MHDKGRWLQGAKKGGAGWSKGRQETDWDSWTDPLGSLAHSQSGDLQTQLDMLDIEAGARDDESELDLVLIVSYMWSLLPEYSNSDFLLLLRRKDSATGYSAIMTWDLHSPEFWKTICHSMTH